VAIGVLFIIVVGLPLEYQGIKQGGTRFYLTNFRLVRAKRGSILTQISRQAFRGKNLSSFLRVLQTPRNNAREREWQPVNNLHIEILDPNSGNVLMSLGWIPEPSVRTLETITQTIYCQYCGRANNPSNTTCSECGANL